MYVEVIHLMDGFDYKKTNRCVKKKDQWRVNSGCEKTMSRVMGKIVRSEEFEVRNEPARKLESLQAVQPDNLRVSASPR